MKYKYEEHVKALEAEIEALQRKVKALEGVKLVVDVSRRPDKRGMMQGPSAVQAEELYRRARTEIAAEAGAGYGRVSLEALYLLPAEFTNAYQRLFLKALKESPGQTGEANPLVKKAPKLTKKGPGHENQKVVVKDRDSGEVIGHEMAEVLDRDPDRGGGAARGGGKRHRDHWLVKDERAFRLKATVDAQLRELAEVIGSSLISRAAGKSGPTAPDGGDSGNSTPQCAGCQRFLKATWKYCPACGTQTNPTLRS